MGDYKCLVLLYKEFAKALEYAKAYTNTMLSSI